MNKITFRDDDISRCTKVERFKEIHNLFIKYNVPHTIALICKEIEKNKELVKYIKQNNIDVQVHAWEHFDFTTDIERLRKELPKAVLQITKLFKKPVTLYPPWNKSNDEVEKIAFDNKLQVSTKKISLSQYLKGVKGDVINFHSWSDECEDLEAALIKYTGK